MGIDFYTTPHGGAAAGMVQLLAKHLEIEMNVINLDLMKGEQLKPEFITINPQHTVPTLVDGGFAITESRAMLTYLQNKYGKDDSLYPKDPQKRALVEMRILFDVSMLYPRFGEAYFAGFYEGEKPEQEKLDKLDEMLAFVEIFLKDGFIAGRDLTLADFSMSAVLSTINAIHCFEKFPKSTEYLEKMKGLLVEWEELNQKGCDFIAQMYNDALKKQEDINKN